MDTNDYFLKLGEYCNFNIGCINKTLADKKKLAKVLGVENKKELDNIRFFISTNFDKYIYRNYKKFPKDEIARFIVDNMCGKDFKCVLEQLKENELQDIQGYVLCYFKRNKDELVEFIIVNKCNYDFKCILENLKESNMQDMLDEVLDYLKRNYDVGEIVNNTIDGLYRSDIVTEFTIYDDDSYILPVIAWLEFPEREREALVLLGLIDGEIPPILAEYFNEMEYDYLSTYEEVFDELPNEVVDKIEKTIDEIYSRAEKPFIEMAKKLYDETLELINNNPDYKIVDYVDCDGSLCYSLGIDKIPVVRINEKRKEQLLNL